jgi:two-component system chemotaxis response regulator CheB
VRVTEPPPDHKYRPSIDTLFRSAAEVGAESGVAVAGAVLTGMGSDGREGVAALKRAGAITLAESQRTAVIFGMPKEAIATGHIDRVLDLPALIDALIRFGREGR